MNRQVDDRQMGYMAVRKKEEWVEAGLQRDRRMGNHMKRGMSVRTWKCEGGQAVG